MKINNANAKAVNVAQTHGRDLNKEVSGKKNKEASSVDLLSASNVKMSEQAHMAKKAKEIASTSSVDEAKVARLQKLIDEGKYHIDSAAIASRLVDEQLATGE